ncbi:MAG: hypothetical protein ACRC9X_05955, partial [Bacteroidales bacterium]
NKAAQKISDISDVIETYSPNGTFTLNGISDSKLSVSYRLVDGSDKDVISIEGKKITILNAGSVKVIAYQWGNRNYFPADSVVFTVIIDQADQTLPTDLKDITKTYNSGNFELLECFTSANLPVLYSIPNNTVVTLVDNAKEVSILSAGETTFYAYHQGDRNYKDVSAKFKITIQPDRQTINVETLTNVYGDDDFDLIFKSSKDSVVTYSLQTPTDVLSLSGERNGTVSILNAGEVKVVATLDCPNYYRIDTTFTITVNKAVQTISECRNIVATYVPSDIFTLGAISDSDLPVSYRLSETSAKDIISISGNTVNILGAGTVSVIAYQWGSRNYLAADSVVFTVLIEKAKQLILPIENIVHSFDIGQFDVHGFASSGLDVSFSVSNNNGVLIIQDKQFKVVGVGENIMVTASQIGNKDYLPADNITFLVTIYKATPIITPDTTIIKTIGDPSFILPQQSTNKSPITFTIEEGTCIDVSGNEATIKSIGEVTIIASQEENDHYAAVSIKFKIVVNRMQQSIITDSHIEKTYGDADFYIEADATSELPLKYTILLGNNFISMQDNKVNILNAGIAKVKIEQEGTEDRYEPASTVITIEIRKKSQTLTSVQNITEYVTASSFELPDFYASSGLPVDVKVPESNGVLHIRENTVYIEQLGSVDIELEQRGNNNYLPASHVFTITIVDVSPLIIEEPSSFESFDGGHYCFVVKATGSNLIYRWYFNGMLISGADSATYCIDYLEKGHTGTYSVLVSNTAGSISSKDVSLAIHTLPDLESLVRLYPNPTTGITNLEIPDILSLEEIAIRNEMGTFVKVIKGNGNFHMQIDIGNLASGFY